VTLARIAAALVGALVLVLAVHEVISVDLWLHLAAGEWMIRTHAVPRVEIFSFTARGHEWVDLHWGYQLLTTFAHRLGGGVGVQILHGAAYLGAFGIVLGRMLGERRRALAIAFVGLVVITGQERVLCRPEAFTLLFLALTWRVSERMLEGRRPPAAWLLLQVAWANMQGLFVLGPALMALRGVGALVDTRLVRRGERARSGGAATGAAAAPHAARWHLVAAAAMLAVSAIGPYHIDGLLLPFRLATQVAGASVYAPVLGELLSPFGGRVVPVLVSVVLATTLVVWLLDRERRMVELVPVLAFAALAVSARRNLLLFALVVAPMVVRGLDRCAARRPRVAMRALDVAAIVLVAVAIASVAGGRYYYEVRSPKTTGLGFSEREYPVAATAHLASIADGGRVFNMLGDGDYLTYHLGESWSVAFDGRAEVYGEALGREILASYTDARAFDAFARRHAIDAILMDVSREMGRRFVVERVREGWVLRFVDGRGAVLAPPGSLAPGEAPYAPAPLADTGVVPVPVALAPWRMDARFPFASARDGRAFAALGFRAQAAASLGEAVRAFPHNADLFGDYGAALLAADRPATARRAFEAALALDGSHDAAAAGLARSLETLEGPGAALAFLGPWCEHHPDAERAWLTLAATRARGGDVPAAIATLETARRRISAAVIPLARLLAATGEADRAQALLRSHLSAHPADGAARALLSRLERGGAEDGP
jgi:tetratricopeptide (TPR) repeat protein